MTSLFLHLLVKDARRSRLWLGLTLAIAALALPLLSLPADDGVAFYLMALQWISGALLVLASVRLVQGDVGPSAFIATKPVRLGDNLLAKAVLIALILFLIGLLQCLHFGLLRLHLGPLDYLLLFVETVLIFGSFSFAALLLALLAGSFGRFMVLAIALAALCGAGTWVFSILKPPFDQANQTWLTQEHLRVSRMVILQAAVIASSLAALCLYAARPASRTLKASIATGILLCLALRIWWPVDFVAALDDRQRIAPPAEAPDPSKISFRLYTSPLMGNRQPSYEGESVDGVAYQNVKHLIILDGLPASWETGFNGWKSVIHLADGRNLDSAGEPTLVPDGNPSPQMAGIPAGTPDPRQVIAPDAILAAYKESAVRDAGTNVTLDGTLSIPLARTVIIADLPLQQGQSATWKRQRVTIGKVTWSPQQVDIDLTEEGARLTLRGGGQPWERLDFYVVNPQRHESLAWRGKGGGGAGYANYWVSPQHLTMFLAGQYGGALELPGDWKDGARLYVAGVESGGEIHAPYHFDSLDLGNNQPVRP
jgi:hypothetical protein